MRNVGQVYLGWIGLNTNRNSFTGETHSSRRIPRGKSQDSYEGWLHFDVASHSGTSEWHSRFETAGCVDAGWYIRLVGCVVTKWSGEFIALFAFA